MGQHGQHPPDGGLTIGDYANGAPNIRLSQIPASFARQIPWMLPALGIMIGASWWFTKDIKRTYTAEGRILVQLGPEYVFTPAGATQRNNSGLTITPDQVVLTEIDIIKNADSMDKVIARMIEDRSPDGSGGVGGEAFAPKLFNKLMVESEGSPAWNNRWNDIVKYVDKSFVVMPKPKSSIVNLVYKHEDGEIAVKTLQAFMDEYKDFRKQIFVLDTASQIAERRKRTEGQLATVERNIQSILDKNGISEFAAEQAGVQKRAEELKAALNTLRGQISATEAALAASEDQLRATPATINLYVDDRASQRLAQAELEKRQLLAKYLPTSNPVKAKEVEISEIRAQIASNGGQAAGGRRVGPNTVHQALMTQRNTYQAQADSFREQEITLQRQLDSSFAKVTRLRQLGPTYTSLVREKTTLEDRLNGLNVKEGEALVNQTLDDSNSSENIKFITEPTKARKGRNMKKIMFALASLGSIFTVMMLALLRVFLDPKLYGPAPQSRLQAQSGSGGGRRSTDFDPIPEPVPAYQPEITPQPAYAPAAAAMTVPQSHEYVPQEIQAYEPQPYEQAQNQAGLQPYDVPTYADGTPANAPYVSSEPSAYPTQPLETGSVATTSELQPYAGAQGDVPVLGSTGQPPYGV